MTDFILDDDMDILIVDGDFVVNESTHQHQKLLIICEKSEFKESPMRGIGASRYLEDKNPDNFLREVRQEFVKDGMEVSTLKIDSSGSLEIDAVYK
jgi:hypothetical protein